MWEQRASAPGRPFERFARAVRTNEGPSPRSPPENLRTRPLHARHSSARGLRTMPLWRSSVLASLPSQPFLALAHSHRPPHRNRYGSRVATRIVNARRVAIARAAQVNHGSMRRMGSHPTQESWVALRRDAEGMDRSGLSLHDGGRARRGRTPRCQKALRVRTLCASQTRHVTSPAPNSRNAWGVRVTPSADFGLFCERHRSERSRPGARSHATGSIQAVAVGFAPHSNSLQLRTSLARGVGFA